MWNNLSLNVHTLKLIPLIPVSVFSVVVLTRFINHIESHNLKGQLSLFSFSDFSMCGLLLNP